MRIYYWPLLVGAEGGGGMLGDSPEKGNPGEPPGIWTMVSTLNFPTTGLKRMKIHGLPA